MYNPEDIKLVKQDVSSNVDKLWEIRAKSNNEKIGQVLGYKDYVKANNQDRLRSLFAWRYSIEIYNKTLARQIIGKPDLKYICEVLNRN